MMISVAVKELVPVSVVALSPVAIAHRKPRRLARGQGWGQTDAVIYYVAPLVLGASFVGLCLVLRAEQRARRRK
jgi:hypothetical protein